MPWSFDAMQSSFLKSQELFNDAWALEKYQMIWNRDAGLVKKDAFIDIKFPHLRD